MPRGSLLESRHIHKAAADGDLRRQRSACHFLFDLNLSEEISKDAQIARQAGLLRGHGNLRDLVGGRRMRAAVGDHGGGEGARRGMAMSLGAEIATARLKSNEARQEATPAGLSGRRFHMLYATSDMMAGFTDAAQLG
jgi:hypothetical protein